MKISEEEKVHRSTTASRQRVCLLMSLLGLTFSGLVLEVCLTRLFSVIFLHGYVYLLISLSMAGLGFGALLIYYIKERHQGSLISSLIVLPLLCFVLLLGLSYLQTNVVVSLIPTILLFICIGAANTLIFQRCDCSMSILYGIDLCGAATGALCSFFLLNMIGAVKAVLLAVIIVILAIILLHAVLFRPSSLGLMGKALVATVALAIFPLDFNALVTPQNNRLKDMSRVLSAKTDNPRIIATRWTAFGRSDLVETDNPLVKTLYIDGAAGTKMLKMEGGVLSKEMKEALHYQHVTGIALLPIPAKQRRNALVVGSGGGIDVVTLLASDYQDISAVEINPDFITLVKQYRQYNGDIYDNHPNVTVINQEGRSFIRAAERKYDLILMSLPIIKSARNVGSYALTENHLFTYQAFNEYWQALEDEGYLIIVTHYPGEVYRLVTNALKAFETRNVEPPLAMEHIVLVGRDTTPAMILRKKPFSIKDAEVYYGMIRAMHQEGTSNFIPHVEQHTIEYRSGENEQVQSKKMINPGLYALSKGKTDLNSFMASDPENINWISDDSPFFYQLDKGVPREISILLLAGSLLFLIFTLFFLKPSYRQRVSNLDHFFGFSMIGFAFIMIEISVIQKFILFWSHQTLALAFLLALILFSAGIGAFTSRLLINTKYNFEKCLGAILIVVFLFILFNGLVLRAFEAKSLLVKVAASAVLVGPLFFTMGFPFPLLLARVKKRGKTLLFPWMIGINSIATLLGGGLSIWLAMQVGYRFVLLSGVGIYSLLLIWFALIGKKTLSTI
jgi:spermidine synthase